MLVPLGAKEFNGAGEALQNHLACASEFPLGRIEVHLYSISLTLSVERVAQGALTVLMSGQICPETEKPKSVRFLRSCCQRAQNCSTEPQLKPVQRAKEAALAENAF